MTCLFLTPESSPLQRLCSCEMGAEKPHATRTEVHVHRGSACIESHWKAAIALIGRITEIMGSPYILLVGFKFAQM